MYSKQIEHLKAVQVALNYNKILDAISDMNTH